ncbi:hypothetical protein HAX54_046338, partial [Datura stramonium]|nr:hypothetical protein [Datura stramonium]
MAGENIELRERLARLEALVGRTDDSIRTLEAEYAVKHDAVKAEMEIVRKEKEDLRAEVLLLRRALQGTVFHSEERTKLKVPEPKAYN